MDNPVRTKPARGFTFIIALFTFIYPLGVIFLLLAWLSLQGYDRLPWQHATLPFYGLVFLIGCVGIYRIWRRKKWGVYTLAGTWLLTGLLNLLFVPPSPLPYLYTFLAVLLVIPFFLLLLPEWSRMQ